jgi:hypothetical protein
MKGSQAGSYSDHSKEGENLHGSTLHRRQRMKGSQADPVSGEVGDVGEMMFESESDQRLNQRHPQNQQEIQYIHQERKGLREIVRNYFLKKGEEKMKRKMKTRKKMSKKKKKTKRRKKRTKKMKKKKKRKKKERNYS